MNCIRYLPEGSAFLRAIAPPEHSGRKHAIPGAEEAIERVRRVMGGAA